MSYSLSNLNNDQDSSSSSSSSSSSDNKYPDKTETPFHIPVILIPKTRKIQISCSSAGYSAGIFVFPCIKKAPLSLIVKKFAEFLNLKPNYYIFIQAPKTQLDHLENVKSNEKFRYGWSDHPEYISKRNIPEISSVTVEELYRAIKPSKAEAFQLIYTPITENFKPTTFSHAKRNKYIVPKRKGLSEFDETAKAKLASMRSKRKRAQVAFKPFPEPVEPIYNITNDTGVPINAITSGSRFKPSSYHSRDISNQGWSGTGYGHPSRSNTNSLHEPMRTSTPIKRVVPIIDEPVTQMDMSATMTHHFG